MSETILHPEEREGLLIPIFDRSDLNAAEADNIFKAQQWVVQNRQKIRSSLLTVSGLLMLHEKMFSDVWKWAGTIRKTAKNIGIDALQILPSLKQLCENVSFQLENKSTSTDQIAVFFYHQLTFIHPFPNGNGRHARLAVDALLLAHKTKAFAWGAQYAVAEERRRKHIQALHVADEGDLAPLLLFVRD